MSEPLPPLPGPGQQPPPFDPAHLPPLPPRSEPPSIWPKFWLGVLVNIISVVLSLVVQNPIPFFLAGLVTFVGLFYNKYRVIFIGFITTFGVVLLVSLIACGAIIVATSHQ